MKRVLLFLFGILMISNVMALGITPGRTTIDFERGLSRTIYFDIINSEQEDIKVVFAVDGELGQYINLGIESAEIEATEHKKTFSFDLNLPQKLESGLRVGKVYAIKIPSSSSLGDSSISATLAVATQVHVNVPYPGKYATATMVIYNPESGRDVSFVFPVTSKGEFDLTNVYANVDIYNIINEKVGSFTTSSIGILSGERKELIHKLDKQLVEGEYRAVATVIYDEGGKIDLEENFVVGSRKLELQEIIVNNFRLGEIAKLEMIVENKWSEGFDNVYTETRIINDNNDVVSRFKSSSNSISALAKQVFVSYWDTGGVREGIYKAEIEISYEGKSDMNELQFKVTQNDLTVIGLGYVISSNRSGGDNTLIVVLIIAIVTLIFINLLWFLVIRNKMEKKK